MRKLVQAGLLLLLAAGLAWAQTFETKGAWARGQTFTIGSAVTEFVVAVDPLAEETVITIADLRVTTDNKQLSVTISTDGGSTYIGGTGYRSVSILTSTFGTNETIDRNDGTAKWDLTSTSSFGVKSDSDASLSVRLTDFGDDGDAIASWSGFVGLSGGSGLRVNGSGTVATAGSRITHVKFLTDDATGFTQGNARVLSWLGY